MVEGVLLLVDWCHWTILRGTANVLSISKATGGGVSELIIIELYLMSHIELLGIHLGYGSLQDLPDVDFVIRWSILGGLLLGVEEV
jgi:hypothetical protein